MPDQTFQVAALVVYFGLMIGIGWYAYRQTSDHEGYMLAGRQLPPWTAALSAGASDMSGWLMMGLPGAIYAAGLIEAWIAIGLTIGAYLNWRLVAPRLRSYTEVAKNSITIPSFFENRLRDRSRSLRIVSGLIILIFFTLYISSVLKTAVFGFLIAATGAYQGLTTTGGTEGVGRAATRSVVMASVLVIAVNVVLVRLIFVLFPELQ